MFLVKYERMSIAVTNTTSFHFQIVVDRFCNIDGIENGDSLSLFVQESSPDDLISKSC